jgi:hypothetical protein
LERLNGVSSFATHYRLTCPSEQTGVSCRNARSHSFSFSRAAQRVYSGEAGKLIGLADAE